MIERYYLSTYINCNQSSLMGGSIVTTALQLNQTLNKLRDIKNVLDQMQTGSPADWVSVATYCGVTESEAPTLYGEIATALADIDTAAVKQMCARLARGY